MMSHEAEPTAYEAEAKHVFPWDPNYDDRDNSALIKRVKYEDEAHGDATTTAEENSDITAWDDHKQVAKFEYHRFKWKKAKAETKEHHAKVLKKEMADVFRTAHLEVERDNKKEFIKKHPHSKQAKAARKKAADAEKAAKEAIKNKAKTKELNKKTFEKQLKFDNSLVKGGLPPVPPPTRKQAKASLKSALHGVAGAADDVGKHARHAELKKGKKGLASATSAIFSLIKKVTKGSKKAADKDMKGALEKIFALVKSAHKTPPSVSAAVEGVAGAAAKVYSSEEADAGKGVESAEGAISADAAADAAGAHKAAAAKLAKALKGLAKAAGLPTSAGEGMAGLEKAAGKIGAEIAKYKKDHADGKLDAKGKAMEAALAKLESVATHEVGKVRASAGASLTKAVFGVKIAAADSDKA